MARVVIYIRVCLVSVAATSLLRAVIYTFGFSEATGKIAGVVVSCGLLFAFITEESSLPAPASSKNVTPAPEWRESSLQAMEGYADGKSALQQFVRKHVQFHGRSPLQRGNLLIHLAASKGDLLTVEREFKFLEDSGTCPDVSTYNRVLNACTRAHDPQQAELWIAKMAADGIRPNVVSYTCVIDAWASIPLASRSSTEGGSKKLQRKRSKANAARAEHWFDCMIAAGVLPNDRSFGAIIRACARALDVSSAVRFLDRMDEAGVAGNEIHYASVLEACARSGNARVSSEVLARMRAAGIKPNIRCYIAAARVQVITGGYRRIEKLQEEMALDGIQQDKHFLQALIVAYGNSLALNPKGARDEVQA